MVLQGGKSRVDFVLDTLEGGEMHVEVKSVTLAAPLLSSEPGMSPLPSAAYT